MSKYYPRVLVVNYDPFNSQRNNGLTMSNLFLGWPKDSLAQIYLSKITPTDNICNNYWRLSEISLLKGLLGFSTSAEYFYYTESNAVSITESSNHILAPVENLLRKLDRKYTEPIRELLYRLPSVTSASMMEWIEKFKPDVIYSMLGNGPLVRLVVKISEKYDIPIVPHFTDDWLTTQYNNALFSKMLKASMDYWLRQMLVRSVKKLTIGTAMSHEYQRRYGGHYQDFVNCLDPDLFNPDFPDSLVDSSTIQLLYVGGLHLNRWKSLKKIGQALMVLREKYAINAQLNIYTYSYDVESYKDELLIDPVMRVVGWVPNSEVPLLMSNAHVLVHVESFDEDVSKYTKFSVSTKIPECLMAGRAILAFGPPVAASIRYIHDSSCGLSIDLDDEHHIISSLKNFLSSKEGLIDLGIKAREFAAAKHDANIQREMFRCAIVESLSTSK